MKTFLKIMSMVLTLCLVTLIIWMVGSLNALNLIGSFAIGWWMADLTLYINRKIDESYESKELTVVQWSESEKEEEEE